MNAHEQKTAGRQKVSATCSTASWHARMVVILGGVPEPVIDRAEQRGEVDWRPLAGQLDDLSLAAGGQLDGKRFLLTPHRELAGRTPLEALDGPAAAQRLAELISDRARALHHARVADRLEPTQPITAARSDRSPGSSRPT